MGVSTGEALNEQVTTARWPNIDVLARYPPYARPPS